jgi:hypothetical protein
VHNRAGILQERLELRCEDGVAVIDRVSPRASGLYFRKEQAKQGGADAVKGAHYAARLGQREPK